MEKSFEKVLNLWENAVILQTRNKYKYMEYDFEEKGESSHVAEPAVAYGIQERVAYMRNHLHPDTVKYLEQWDFMVDSPFPYDEIDEHWFDEPDQENPAVSNDIVLHDKEVWLHA